VLDYETTLLPKVGVAHPPNELVLRPFLLANFREHFFETV
jgi:hypothetical protein